MRAESHVTNHPHPHTYTLLWFCPQTRKWWRMQLLCRRDNTTAVCAPHQSFQYHEGFTVAVRETTPESDGARWDGMHAMPSAGASVATGGI